jgi:hypothetical protein
MCSFRTVVRKGNEKAKGGKGSKKAEGMVDGSMRKSNASLKKRKRASPEEEEDDDGEDDGLRASGKHESSGEGGKSVVTWRLPLEDAKSAGFEHDDDDDSEEGNDDWAFSFRSSRPHLKKSRRSETSKGRSPRKTVFERDVEVIVLSSD